MLKLLTILVLLTLSPTLALAHPGHGSTPPDSWAHGFEAAHLGSGVLVFAVAVAAIALFIRKAVRS